MCIRDRYKNADTTSLRQKTGHEMTRLDQGRVKTSSKHHRSHIRTPSNSDEDPGDLRGMLEERHYQRNKTLDESKRVVKVVHDIRSKPYDAPSRQYGHNTDHKGSSVKSDREKSGLPDNDRRSQGMRHWITITAVTRALTGDPGRETDTRAAKVTAEAARAKEVRKPGNDTNTTTQCKPEEAGRATRTGGGDYSWR